MDASETVVVLVTPEAEPAVGDLRRRHTPSGRRGMPCHVTLLAPFVDADSFDDDIVRRLGDAIGNFPSFDYEMSELSRFDTGVLYLTVSPVEPFRKLIGHICDAFPEFRPYGRFTPDEVIPHQTVATGDGFPNGPTARDNEVFNRAEAALSGSLPIACHAKHMAVLAGGWWMGGSEELRSCKSKRHND